MSSQCMLGCMTDEACIVYRNGISLRRDVSFFFFQAEDGIRDLTVTGVQTCALPIWSSRLKYSASRRDFSSVEVVAPIASTRSEEHTSELQSQSNLVCRLLLEKKKKKTILIVRPTDHYSRIKYYSDSVSR